MTPERWLEIKRIFHAALDLPSADRPAFVRQSTGPDQDLRAEVESLLRSEEDAATFLSEAASAYVPGALAGESVDRNLGRQIGAYRIVRQIGEGGMGAVYLAERADEFHQKAALKLLRPEMDSRAIVSRFRHERKILAALEHPYIARLFDGGTTEDGRPYFVMEFVEGEPIDTWCNRRKTGLAERLDLFRKVCAAVQYAHQNLIVHRDIKPGNILVTAEGIPKLLDFGIAKLLKVASPETVVMTQMGVRLMTPQYASPEQVRGAAVTTATDVYSLGSVLYELLTGQAPYVFPSESLAAVEHVICEVEPRPPSSLAAEPLARQLSGDLDTILLKALQKEPARRYTSVEQLSDDLARYLIGDPIQARPQTFLYKTSRFVRRNRLSVAAASLVFLSLTTGLAATAWQARIARQQRLRAERRFNDVRQLAHVFLFDFHDAIEKLPGAAPARRLVVDKALEYLNGLSREAAGDPALERELAEAYLRVGDVQGNPFGPNLGDAPGALQSYRHAQSISQAALARDPNDLAFQRYLARADDSLGDILEARGDSAQAAQLAREAIRLLETVSARLPYDAGVRQNLASSYEGLADRIGHPGYPNLGDFLGAKEAYHKARSVYEAMLATQPANLRAQRALGVMDMKRGDVDLFLGDAATALSEFRSANAIFERSLAGDPLNATTRLFLGIVSGKIAAALEASGETAAALDQYRKNSEIQRRLLDQDDPKNVQTRNSYALSLQDRAALLRKTGDRAGAAALYREATAIMRQLHLDFPANLVRHGTSAESELMLARVLAEQGQKDEAAHLYREGLGVLKTLADRDGATPGDLSNYAGQLLACPLPEFANPAAALPYAKQAVERTHEAKVDYLEQLARACHATGDSAGAVAYQTKAAALLPPTAPKRKQVEAQAAAYRNPPKP